MKYIIRDKEAGNVIEIAESAEEAKKIVAGYESEDKAEDAYTPDFYEIIPLLQFECDEKSHMAGGVVFRGSICNNEDDAKDRPAEVFIPHDGSKWCDPDFGYNKDLTPDELECLELWAETSGDVSGLDNDDYIQVYEAGKEDYVEHDR